MKTNISPFTFYSRILFYTVNFFLPPPFNKILPCPCLQDTTLSKNPKKIKWCGYPLSLSNYNFLSFIDAWHLVSVIYGTSGKELLWVTFWTCWHTFQNIIILAATLTVVGCRVRILKRKKERCKHIAIFFSPPFSCILGIFKNCALGSVLTWYLQVNDKVC